MAPLDGSSMQAVHPVASFEGPIVTSRTRGRAMTDAVAFALNMRMAFQAPPAGEAMLVSTPLHTGNDAQSATRPNAYDRLDLDHCQLARFAAAHAVSAPNAHGSGVSCASRRTAACGQAKAGRTDAATPTLASSGSSTRQLNLDRRVQK
jgi:hypothetical protein